MKIRSFLILFFIIFSCQAQVTTAYEDKVYKLLNSVYKRKSKSLVKSKDALIHIDHRLDTSYKNVNELLLKEVLRQGKLINRVYVPDSISDLNNWRNADTKVSNNQFSQDKITIPNLYFIERNNVDSKKINFRIDGVLFYGDFAIIVTNIGGTIPIASLFKIREKSYKLAAMTGYPPLGDE